MALVIPFEAIEERARERAGGAQVLVQAPAGTEVAGSAARRR